MSTQNNQTDNTGDNTVDNQPHEEVDYVDSESPTLAIWQLSSSTTGPTERQTDALETNDFVYTWHRLARHEWNHTRNTRRTHDVFKLATTVQGTARS